MILLTEHKIHMITKLLEHTHITDKELMIKYLSKDLFCRSLDL